MEIGFSPVSPVPPVRGAGGVRPRLPEVGAQAPLPPRERSVPEPPGASPSNQAGDSRATGGAERAVRADFPRARIQPELPPTTRNALEVFVRNSFSEEEDPANSLGGIDVFV